VIRAAISALVVYVSSPRGASRGRDVIIEAINGETAVNSELARLLREAGFKSEGRSLRYYARIL
jgi:hypothetical protein